MVDVGDEPCNCDCDLEAGTEFDDEDRPYYRPENVARWVSER
jgi:hypothetical protein